MKQHISRYLLTLVALFAMTAGAWAADDVLLTTIESKDYTSFTSGSKTFDDKVTVTFSGEVANDGDWGWYQLTGITLTVTPVEGITITRVKFTCKDGSAFDETAPFEAVLGDPWTNPYMLVNGESYGEFGVTKIEVYGAAAPAVEVTTNAASEGATFTEASFQMPAFDATAEYELVRDMSVQMTAQVGDGTDGYRIRIKKNAQSGKYEPAEMEFQDMLALFSVTDQIEEKSLVCYGQGAVCQLKVYAVDDNDQPTGDPILFANLEPGRYIVKAQAVDDSDYDGETALSNIFVLFQGFEVAVPAKEFATYYKNEAVYADPETSSNAELYTIANVNGDQAVLSSAIDAVPSNTPLIIYNNSDQDKVFLLIPCNEPDLALNVYNGFIGTLVSTTIAASTASQTNYALNGKQFVFVKDAISIGANKCWLSVENVSNAPARAINIVFEEGTTEVSEVNEVNGVNDDSWYDLSGRKLNGEPTTKGVFIKNGKKVMR